MHLFVCMLFLIKSTEKFVWKHICKIHEKLQSQTPVNSNQEKIEHFQDALVSECPIFITFSPLSLEVLSMGQSLPPPKGIVVNTESYCHCRARGSYTTDIQWGMDRDSTKHSTIHGIVLTTNNLLTQNDNIGEVINHSL